MNTESLDLNSLRARINDIKKEGEESTDFTIGFLECLMFRHDLVDCLYEDIELENVPDMILDKLKIGDIPTKDEVILMSSDAQNHLCFELIWLCGMGALSSYGADNDSEGEDGPSTLDIILSMSDISHAHYMGTYLIAALTLLMAQIPTQELISSLTNDFDCADEQLEKNMDIFVELASSIITRYREDLAYSVYNEEEN